MRAIAQDHLTHISQILHGLNEMEETINHVNPGNGLNAQLHSKLPITTCVDELIGYAVDEIGGVWNFLPATTEQANAWENRDKE